MTIIGMKPIFTDMELLTPPVRPWRGERNTDTLGSGHFGASRDNGTRRHLGADFIAQPGDDVVSPVDGTVTRLGSAYADTSQLQTVTVRGRGKHEGIEVRVLYVQPIVTTGQRVTAGQVIGRAQDVSVRYPGITNHVHCETWRAANPVELMPRMRPPESDA